MKRKTIKPNKYQLKSDLTGPIWLAEMTPDLVRTNKGLGQMFS